MATWPTITDDDGSGTTGTVLDNASVWTPIQSYIGGAWSSVSFSAGNFTTDTGSWTVASGDQSAFAYVEVGKTMLMSVVLITTTVASSPTQLRITIPNGRTAQRTMRGVFYGTDNGTDITSIWEAPAGATYIRFYRNASVSAWGASTNNTAIFAQIAFEIA